MTAFNEMVKQQLVMKNGMGFPASGDVNSERLDHVRY